MLWTAKLLLFVQTTVLHLICLLFFRPRHKLFEAKRILILRTAALGDFLFAVPSMVALRRRFPLAKCILLTTPTTNPVVRRAVQNYIGDAKILPWLNFMVPSVIDEAITFYSFDSNTFGNLRRRVRAFNPDLTFILSHSGEPGLGLLKKILLLKFLGVRNPVYGWRMRATKSVLREAQQKAGMFEHQVIGALRAVTESPLMPRIEEIKVEFPLSIESSAENWVESLWREKGWKDAYVVGIAPGSVQPHKCWPIRRFVLLCQQLVATYSIVLVIIGTKNDRDLGDSIGKSIRSEVTNLAGETTIMQAAALLKRFVMVVGNDGGAMHLSAAMGRPCVSIIPGIEYPGSIEPWGSRDLAVRHLIPCAPCYSFTNCPLGHNLCMSDLSVGEVFVKCATVLDKTGCSREIAKKL